VSAIDPIVVPGSSALVLVAPHGGRRDYDRRPWGRAPLKVNDLHTASLTEELAAATGAAAIINAAVDRNDLDLNRVSAAHDGAPGFLERLGELVSGALDRHGRATVLTVHGWNVIQPAVDLGFGSTRGAPVDAAAAVSPAFAMSAVPALVRACAARGIAATVGARYPARGRENLVQLFTPRYRNDRRPLVRQLAALGAHADAMQLELGVPLRWPGAWRRRLADACVESLSALVGDGGAAAHEPATRPFVSAWPKRRTLEVVADGASALVALDALGARLLVFPPEGGLAHFTGERTGGEEPGRVAGLCVDDGETGTLHVRFTGPMMRFPDTTPFLDLERGLGAASVIEQVDVALEFVPAHAGGAGAEFGAVRGTAVLDGRRLGIDGQGFTTRGDGPGLWPRVRASLTIGDGTWLALTVGLADGASTGFLCHDGRHRPVVRARTRLGSSDDPLEGFSLEVELEGGDHLLVEPEPVHRLPVVRGSAPAPVRLLYAACRLPGVPGLAGWCEIGGV
jgi:hypothetical protein